MPWFRHTGRARYCSRGEGLLGARADRGFGRFRGGVRRMRRSRRIDLVGRRAGLLHPRRLARRRRVGRQPGPHRVIRPATEEDVAELLAMICELAEFESLSDQCVCTEDDLRRVLFEPGAVVHDTVAVADDGSVVGHALWFRTFSTFMGKTGIWLEDLYVRPAHRRQGHAGDAHGRPAVAHRRPGGVGSARVERRGHRLLPAPRRPAHGRVDPVSLDPQPSPRRSAAAGVRFDGAAHRGHHAPWPVPRPRPTSWRWPAARAGRPAPPRRAGLVAVDQGVGDDGPGHRRRRRGGVGPPGGRRGDRPRRRGGDGRPGGRPHAPRVDEAVGRRVRAHRAAPGDHGGGRRSPRGGQRLRHPRRGRADRRGPPAPVHLRGLRQQLRARPRPSRARAPSCSPPTSPPCSTSTPPSGWPRS